MPSPVFPCAGPVWRREFPRFGRKLSSATPQQRQGAYQVIVASTSALAGSNAGDVWDSGRVA